MSTGVGGQPLLRRPRRRLDGDGPVLRPGPEAARPAVGVDQGRLPAPDDQGPGRHSPATAPVPRRRAPSPRCWPRSWAGAGVGRQHFFDDLGADSMVMARFCARVRKRPDLPSVSIKDIYQHPTITSLAARTRGTRPFRRVAGSDLGRVAGRDPAEVAETGRDTAGTSCAERCSSWSSSATPISSRWSSIWASSGSPRAPAARHLPAVGRFRRRDVPRPVALPIVAKWVLIGRWKPGDPHLEPGLRPLLDRQDADPANPLVLFAGSPLLRALSAGAGREDRARRRDLLPHVPVCTDLLTIGDGHGHPQGLVLPRLPGPRRADPDGPGHPRARTCSSARRRCSTSRPRWATGRSSATPPRCTPGRPCRPASAGTGPRRSGPTSTTGRSSRADCGTAAEGGYASWQLLTLLVVYVPLAVGGVTPAAPVRSRS